MKAFNIFEHVKYLYVLKSISLIICFSALFSTFVISEAATTYYVDVKHLRASDNNSGTYVASPFKTIQKAADVVVAGDTVIVKDGIYTDTNNDNYVVLIRRSGTPGKWITFKSENKWGAVIDGKNRTTGYGFVFAKLNYFIRIEGFDIRNLETKGIHINRANSNISVCNNKIHHIGLLQTSTGNGQCGIYCGSNTNNITIDGNYMYEIGRNGTVTNRDHGIYLAALRILTTLL